MVLLWAILLSMHSISSTMRTCSNKHSTTLSTPCKCSSTTHNMVEVVIHRMAHIRRRPLQAIPLGHPIIREKNRQLSKSIRTPFGFDCFVYYIKTLVPWLLYHPVSEILFDINACNKSQLFIVFSKHMFQSNQRLIIYLSVIISDQFEIKLNFYGSGGNLITNSYWV